MSAGLRDIPDLGWSVSDTVAPVLLVALLVWLLPAWALGLLAWICGSFAIALLWGRVARFGGDDE